MTREHARVRSAAALPAISLALALTGAANAGVINSASVFDNLPHTHISFETRGNGAPISLLQGQTMVMPVGEYAAQGLVFDSPVRWVNDGNALFDAAQAAAGTQHISIPSSYVNTVSFTFDVPVQIMGVFMASNRTADLAGPMIRAFDIDGEEIEAFHFTSALANASLTSPAGTVDYGFVGVESLVGIHRVVITKTAAIIDDIRFAPTPAPAPGGAALIGLAALSAMRRRR